MRKLKPAFFICMFVLLCFPANPIKAQWCNATSYGYGNTYGGDITEIEISDDYSTLASYTGLGSNTVQQNLNQGSPISVKEGQILYVKLNAINTQGWGWGTYAGVWIDANRDGDFSDAEECVADPQGGPFSYLGSYGIKEAIKVPCTTNPGVTRMRFRGCWSYYAKNLTRSSSCNNPGVNGNQFDLELNIQKGDTPQAAFSMPPDPNYVKTNIKFRANNARLAYDNQWDFTINANPQTGTGYLTSSKWNSAGTYAVKMVQNNCGLKDSITQNIKIVSPTAVPIADFAASKNVIEINQRVSLYDLSSNGAYTWDWELISPTGKVYTHNVQYPDFYLNETGKWTACLTPSNDIGTGIRYCKSNFIQCEPYSVYKMGTRDTAFNANGEFYDNGNLYGNYTNKLKATHHHFLIFPCGAKEIILKFKNLKLADIGDKLKIYDGLSDTGKLLVTIHGHNYNYYEKQVFKAISGAMYITFESDFAGNAAGWDAIWESDIAPLQKPETSWETAYNPAAVGAEVKFVQKTKNLQGLARYNWKIDSTAGMGFNAELFYQFNAPGTYQVCATIDACNGKDTACKNIQIFIPNKPVTVDIQASNSRPELREAVTLSAITDYASNYEWTITPPTFSYLSGTNLNSKNPIVWFNACGSYTIAVKTWNSSNVKSATFKTLEKKQFVIEKCGCTPVTQNLSADIGLNRVEIKRDSNLILQKISESGNQSFTDYSYKTTPLIFGTNYTLTIGRKTALNKVNYKAWIDYNSDGDFTDTGEEVLKSGVISGKEYSTIFRVPSKALSFEGKTKMRVAVAYDTFQNSPCGINMNGEFEDYGIELRTDNDIPVIKLIGEDTIYVEKANSAKACYQDVMHKTYEAFDLTLGDITDAVKISTNLDCTQPGIYSITYNVWDASENRALPVTRTVYVMGDLTKPQIFIHGFAEILVEQCEKYYELGASAYDLVDGNLTTALQSTGNVNTQITGTYLIKYFVTDQQGNASDTARRTVRVIDTKKPVLYLDGRPLVFDTTIHVQINLGFKDDVHAIDPCNGRIAVDKVAGSTGPVNPKKAGLYKITYFATDPSGNEANENGYHINYRVDDFIPPEIELNSNDTLIHDVGKPYVANAISVKDNFYDSTQLTITLEGAVDANVTGIYTQTITAEDPSGNRASNNRVVIVADREAPVMSGSEITLCVGTPFWALSGINVRDNYYTPATLLPLVRVHSHNVNIWEAGVYYIVYELTDPSGNPAAMISRTVKVVYPPNCTNSPASSVKTDMESRIQVFPNPSKGIFYVQYKQLAGETLDVEVFNAAGKKVQQTHGRSAGNGLLTLDLQALPNGVYTARFTQNEIFCRQLVLLR